MFRKAQPDRFTKYSQRLDRTFYGFQILLQVYSSCRISLVERLRFPFTPIGRREFLPRDQVSPIFSVYSLLLLHKNKYFYASFNHRNSPELSVCLFSILGNSQLEPFVVNLNHNLSIIFFFTNGCSVKGHYKNYPMVVMFPPYG